MVALHPHVEQPTTSSGPSAKTTKVWSLGLSMMFFQKLAGPEQGCLSAPSLAAKLRTYFLQSQQIHLPNDHLQEWAILSTWATSAMGLTLALA